MPALVTVLIPAYNAARTIVRALDSVFLQDYPNFEIVVVDDCSRDNTSEIVTNYGRGVQLLRLPRNRGEGGALNAGLEIARGDYVAFLDADDEWLPGKIRRQVELLEENPRSVIATCGCRRVDANGTTIEVFGLPPADFRKDDIWRWLLIKALIAKPCVVARRSAIGQVGIFDTTIPIAADQDMWIRLAMIGDVEFVGEYLTIAHDTPGSLTKVYLGRAYRSEMTVVRRHIAARKDDLSMQEIRHVLRERYTSIGRNLYLHGHLLEGAALLGRAAIFGGHPVENLWYLVTAAPVSRWLKGMFRPDSRKSA